MDGAEIVHVSLFPETRDTMNHATNMGSESVGWEPSRLTITSSSDAQEESYPAGMGLTNESMSSTGHSWVRWHPK
eukprot:2460921-Amphidinium_carterae.1